MGIGDLRAEAKRLRSAEPSKAIRGFDEGQTRKLLDDAAKLLETAAREQETLQQECERLRSAAAEDASAREAIGTALLTATCTGEEIAAKARAAAEQITAEAEARAATTLEQAEAKAETRERESATAREKLETELAATRAAAAEANAAIRTELEHEREQLAAEQELWRQEAQVQADTIVADARREVEWLQSYGERLRSLLTDSRRRFVELAESALGQLDGIESAKGTSGDEALLDDLRPPKLEETSSAPTAADSLD